jgi:hypothetical protein
VGGLGRGPRLRARPRDDQPADGGAPPTRRSSPCPARSWWSATRPTS